MNIFHGASEELTVGDAVFARRRGSVGMCRISRTTAASWSEGFLVGGVEIDVGLPWPYPNSWLVCFTENQSILRKPPAGISMNCS